MSIESPENRFLQFRRCVRDGQVWEIGDTAYGTPFVERVLPDVSPTDGLYYSYEQWQGFDRNVKTVCDAYLSVTNYLIDKGLVTSYESEDTPIFSEDTPIFSKEFCGTPLRFITQSYAESDPLVAVATKDVCAVLENVLLGVPMDALGYNADRLIRLCGYGFCNHPNRLFRIRLHGAGVSLKEALLDAIYNSAHHLWESGFTNHFFCVIPDYVSLGDGDFAWLYDSAMNIPGMDALIRSKYLPKETIVLCELSKETIQIGVQRPIILQMLYERRNERPESQTILLEVASQIKPVIGENCGIVHCTFNYTEED